MPYPAANDLRLELHTRAERELGRHLLPFTDADVKTLTGLDTQQQRWTFLYMRTKQQDLQNRADIRRLATVHAAARGLGDTEEDCRQLRNARKRARRARR